MYYIFWYQPFFKTLSSNLFSYYKLLKIYEVKTKIKNTSNDNLNSFTKQITLKMPSFMLSIIFEKIKRKIFEKTL